MKLSEKQIIFSKMVGELLLWIYRQTGYGISLGEVLRTPEQQKLYLEQGKSKTANSMHLYKLAIDLNLFINGVYVLDENKYRKLGEYWEQLGKANNITARWGGRFGVNPADYHKTLGWDPGHFEVYHTTN